MEPIAYWCVSACLMVFGVVALTVAILRLSPSEKFTNKRSAELRWQSKNTNTDWWLDIEKKKNDNR